MGDYDNEYVGMTNNDVLFYMLLIWEDDLIYYEKNNTVGRENLQDTVIIYFAYKSVCVCV